jgi:MFS family permease
MKAQSSKPLILASLLLAAFAINLDTTIVNVALPSLVRELHASDTQLEWIVDAYNLVFAALVLAAGKLGDRVGRKGVLLAGSASSASPASRAASDRPRAS